MLSGIFPKKMPPFTTLNRAREFWNRSSPVYNAVCLELSRVFRQFQEIHRFSRFRIGFTVDRRFRENPSAWGLFRNTHKILGCYDEWSAGKNREEDLRIDRPDAPALQRRRCGRRTARRLCPRESRPCRERPGGDQRPCCARPAKWTTSGPGSKLKRRVQNSKLSRASGRCGGTRQSCRARYSLSRRKLITWSAWTTPAMRPWASTTARE